MKRMFTSIRGFLFTLSLFLIFAFSYSFKSSVKPGDCDTNKLMETCASELDDYVYIKSFDISTKKEEDKVEYSYVLSRDVTYRIITCEMDVEKRAMIINLFDRAHKLIASNYLKSSKKIIPILNYQCSATGVYYVEASFERKNGGCGINIIGFKK